MRIWFNRLTRVQELGLYDALMSPLKVDTEQIQPGNFYINQN